MWKIRIIVLLTLGLGIFLGANVLKTERDGTNPFKLGLDLSGGSYLVYKADVSDVEESEVGTSMDSLRDVIERRINAFGVSEPNVQTETHTLGIEGSEERLIIELPGITDLDEAVEMIGQTPLLEFKVEASEIDKEDIQSQINGLLSINAADISADGSLDLGAIDLEKITELQNQQYISTALTGKYLEKSQLQFSQGGVQNGNGIQTSPIIALSFNKEGAELFEKITEENIGKTLAIYLDGMIVSAPVVNTAISGGQAIIQGDFTIEEAKTTVGRLNSGALPIPIELISTNTIGPTLGRDAVDAGVRAAALGLILVALVLDFGTVTWTDCSDCPWDVYRYYVMDVQVYSRDADFCWNCRVYYIHWNCG